MSTTRHPSSFRDPSGFLFRRDGVLLRQVNTAYAADYDLLSSSGLYDALIARGWLVPHEELAEPPADAESAYRILRPEPIPFIGYPYEWSFGQYRAAALRTLELQQLALEHGMTLKDASAYNIQFIGCRALLIDTLSFERYEEGSPWVAYRQFCQHFLAPLALMSYRDVRLSRLMRTAIDGIELDLAVKLLPWRIRARFGLLSHLVLHAKSQQRMAHSQAERASFTVSPLALRGLIESLTKAVARLAWDLPRTEWGDYYQDTNYSQDSSLEKGELVASFLAAIDPKVVWDLGANDGRFSRLASDAGAYTVAFDMDPVAVEKNFLQATKDQDERLLALCLDLSNPSPALGWNHDERASLVDRGPADAVIALALVHHLAIGNNVPLERVAAFLARVGRQIVIEWVPKEDSQVQRLLASRQDVFPDYTEDGFRQAFDGKFEVARREPIAGSSRVLYWLRQ